MVDGKGRLGTKKKTNGRLDEWRKKHPIFLKRTFGETAADNLSQFAGSWQFIILFIGFLLIWMAINTWFLFAKKFDPYPFILLNLVLSCVAALQAPIILMTQNRQAERDRQFAQYDYKVNRLAERENRQIQKQLDRIERKMK
jgi:uncharacterized membrane protein